MFDARNYRLSDWIDDNLIDYYVDNGEVIEQICIPVLQQLQASFSRMYMSVSVTHLYCIWCDWSRRFDAGWLSEKDNGNKEYDECRDYYIKKAGVV